MSLHYEVGVDTECTPPPPIYYFGSEELTGDKGVSSASMPRFAKYS